MSSLRRLLTKVTPTRQLIVGVAAVVAALPLTAVPASGEAEPRPARGCGPSAFQLGVLAGDTYSRAVGVNQDGWVVGESGSGQSATPGSRAVLWRDGDVYEVDVFGGWDPPDTVERYGSSAIAVNNAGVVAVQRWTAGQDLFLIRSFLWDAGALTRLRGTLTGGYARVNAVNQRGVAVGTALSSDGYTGWPVRWRDGTAEELSVPPRGDLPSPATPAAISSRGLIVGHVTGEMALHPWIWRPDGSGHPLSGLSGERIASLAAPPTSMTVDA